MKFAKLMHLLGRLARQACIERCGLIAGSGAQGAAMARWFDQTEEGKRT
ncbi:MAG: hypothetical protein V4508_06335 [Pseudomonadota bacterium]